MATEAATAQVIIATVVVEVTVNTDVLSFWVKRAVEIESSWEAWSKPSRPQGFRHL
jgi:hypothetical protein